jgi:aryl sulfotransferase
MDNDGFPFWSMWENVRTWWAIRDLPNVFLLRFSGMKRDMPGEMRRIAKFLNIRVDEQHWEQIVEYCSTG